MQSTNPNQLTKEVLSGRQKHLEDLIKRRYYYSLGSEIYSGIAGLYDYGPPGCAIRANIQQFWREFFILEEDMLEISVTCLTPAQVFQASGHVQRFTDNLVRDVQNGQGFRADKLIEQFIDNQITKDKKKLKEDEIKRLLDVKQRAQVASLKEIDEIIKSLGIKSPDTGNELSFPEPFNLMFSTHLGPVGGSVGYLRPETAQGMFVNFNKLLDSNNGRIPFAAAQIGLGFRNEISPRMGLLRCREFDMAEIQHFFDPNEGSHPQFKYYKDHKLTLLNRDDQEKGQKDGVQMTIGQAVAKGIISNETHAYFMIRTFLFLVACGVQDYCIRFRQHRADEMSHYAKDTWDAETLTSYGWVETVGLANRSAYDLTAHTKFSGTKLVAARRLKEPIQVTQITITMDKAKIGKQLKQEGSLLITAIEKLEENEKADLQKHFQTNEFKSFTFDGKEVKLLKEHVKFEKQTVTVVEQKFTPWVIEPAFGLGRIIHIILEHNFHMRNEQRTYIALPPRIAPIKVSLLPVISHQKFDQVLMELKTQLNRAGISNQLEDTSGTVGKRYARTDELGVVFGITVDQETLDKQTVTLREIITTKQVRIPNKEVVQVVRDLADNLLKWEEVLQTYPIFQSQSEEEDSKENV